ncbi:MAG: hypothetical protein Athens101428_17 [Candidatus Berkelbacteria bacterium Athens1014_28]|uniref:Uncharacterized protein n=1 Tax=Candidatus Berkelbacteria bacterium Athens1014_28 TaxID=2017145 RepID=A0A554LRQ0_9BACT|nr:MAG: hypothetical protein Athens101428_17 [Candidatus Berkelbacteria bacterium Athens1014_28]
MVFRNIVDMFILTRKSDYLNFELCILHFELFYYQLDLTTPGMSPREANSRKQIRQRPNFLRKARLRPQTRQRLTILLENFGLLSDFTTCDFFAILFLCAFFSKWNSKKFEEMSCFCLIFC